MPKCLRNWLNDSSGGSFSTSQKSIVKNHPFVDGNKRKGNYDDKINGPITGF